MQSGQLSLGNICESWSASQTDLKMILKLKMKAEVSLVDRLDSLVAMTAVETEKPCQQLYHHELVDARCRLGAVTAVKTESLVNNLAIVS